MTFPHFIEIVNEQFTLTNNNHPYSITPLLPQRDLYMAWNGKPGFSFAKGSKPIMCIYTQYTSVCTMYRYIILPCPIDVTQQYSLLCFSNNSHELFLPIFVFHKTESLYKQQKIQASQKEYTIPHLAKINRWDEHRKFVLLETKLEED